MGTSRRWARTDIALLLAVVTAWRLTVVLAPEGVANLVSNITLLGFATAASWACWRAATREQVACPRSWGAFALASGSWAAGQAVWSVFEALGRDPFPSPADIGYLGAIPFGALAMLAWPVQRSGAHHALRSLLDGLVIASSVLLVSWVTVIGPIARADTAGIARVIALAYPLGDVVLVTIALSALSRARLGRRESTRGLVLVAASMVSLAVADSGFAYLGLIGAYESGHLIDLGWYLAWGLLVVAARTAPPAVERDAVPDALVSGLPRRMTAAAPYTAVALALAAAVAVKLSEGRLSTFLYLDMLVTVGLLLGRQYLAIVENDALARTLDQRVRDRTSELAESEERFRSLVQNSSDVTTVLAADGTIRYQSPSVSRVLGYEADTLVGTRFADLVSPEERERVLADLEAAAGLGADATVTIEADLLHRDGHWCRVETLATNLLGVPAVGGVVLNTRDISERKRLEDQLKAQAEHDSLTGLANRERFRQGLALAIARQRREPGSRPVAVLFCDLDGFKAVNDTIGHSAGDAVLVEWGRRLSSCVRPTDLVARLGGDEFAVMLEAVVGEAEVNAVAGRIVEALRPPIVVEDRSVALATSIGIATADDLDDPGLDPALAADLLLGDADLAMYRAKEAGLGSYERYDAGMRSVLTERFQLEAELRRAVAEDQLGVHYQPVIDLRDGRVVGIEALVRWNAPGRGEVTPATFVPLAEQSPLIVALGSWVLNQACGQVARWRQRWPELTVAVNLSARQLQHPGLVAEVERALRAHDLPPGALVLEMTETVLIEQGEQTSATLRALKALGVRLAIDDFGTGYSSLSYLHRFPVDVLKIDKAFVADVHGSGEAAALTSSIVSLAQTLGLTTIAEGIEAPEQVEALRGMSCELGQGYYLARPLPAAALEEALLDHDGALRPLGPGEAALATCR